VLLPFSAQTDQSSEYISIRSVSCPVTKIPPLAIPPRQNEELASLTLSQTLQGQLHSSGYPSHSSYHGAPVPATSPPSMPNVRAARCPTDRLRGEPQWQRRSSVLCLHKRPAPSYVHDLGRQSRHRQWEPAMLVRLHESQDHNERTRPDRFLFLRCGRMRIF
jgi:hypothetical protein